MSTNSSNAADDNSLEARALEARLVCYDDAPDELTVFPRAVREEDRVTMWITAEAGSFVELDDWR